MDARTGRRQKRISKQQEERVANELGGRTQANSGATRLGGGSDVRVQGELRIECKYTEKNKYNLKLDELLKIKKQAAQALEEPVFQFGFKKRIGGTFFSVTSISASEVNPSVDPTWSPKARSISVDEATLSSFLHWNKRICLVFKDRKTGLDHVFQIEHWDKFLDRKKED